LPFLFSRRLYFLVMKSLFLSAFLVAASFSTACAQGQLPASADSWLDELAEPAAVAPAQAEVDAEVAPTYTMGWNTAPGQSLSLHGRPTTDYWGRPLKKKRKANLTTAAAKEVAYQEQASTDPMMQSSGVMAAPGMNTAPYRRVSTDYWGRPLKQKAKAATTLGKTTAEHSTVASSESAGW
jgi:hypothetical protein